MRRRRRPYDKHDQQERALDIIGRFPGETTEQLRANRGMTAAEERQLPEMESNGLITHDDSNRLFVQSEGEKR